MNTSEFIRYAALCDLEEGMGLCKALSICWKSFQHLRKQNPSHYDENISLEQLDAARDYLHRLLDGHNRLEDWYEANHGSKLDTSDAYKIRLMWAEWVAQQYEAIGD